MNSLLRASRVSSTLLPVVTTFLFFEMTISLFGVVLLSPNHKKGSGLEEKNVQTTEQNRRMPLAEEEYDDAGNPLASSTMSRGTVRSLAPRRNPIEEQHSNLCDQPFSSELAISRNQKDAAVAAERAQISKALSELQTLSQSRLKVVEQTISDKKNSYAARLSALLGLSSYVPSENLDHQKLLAVVEKKITCYQLELQQMVSYLPKRAALLFKDDNFPLNKSQNVVKESLERAQEIGDALIQDVCKSAPGSKATSNDQLESLPSLSDEQLLFLDKVIDLVQKIQLFILGYHSSSFITMNKEQLAEVEAKLMEIPINGVTLQEFEDPDQVDNFSTAEPNQSENFSTEVRDLYLAAQKFLKNNQALFLLKEAETIPTEKASFTAQESARIIRQNVEKIEERKTSIQSEVEETRENNKESIENDLAAMTTLHDLLLNASLSYSAIEDETSIEEKSGNLNQLHDQIIRAIEELTDQGTKLNFTTHTARLSSLETLLEREEFKINAPDLQPMRPLAFLSALNSLENLDRDRIIGTHGRIALDPIKHKRQEDRSSPIPEEDYTEKTRREWTSGIDLIRLAICRTFGIHVINEFDQMFFTKIKHKNSLKVQEVKQFLFDAQNQLKHSPGFFVDSQMSHADFLKISKAISTQESSFPHKVIKKDQERLAFNPFIKKFPNSQYESFFDETSQQDEDIRQREAGFEYVREALREAFPEEFLTKNQMDEILLKFDTKFNVVEDSTLLTLETLHDFIDTERDILRKRPYCSKYMARYLDSDAIRNLRNGLFMSIGSHILPFIFGILSYIAIQSRS
ncbi:MAG: hypothetical protein K2W97_00745 [Chthoniobacterales bacterium]|nr:hypothetical protein [Chthoniobacterales bacterium]